MATNIEAPRRNVPTAGKWPALLLAIGVHLVFIAVLVFSIRWQNRKPEPVVAELYAPPPKAVEVPRPVPPPPPPKPEPKIEPPVPPPPVEKPDQRAAEIAFKAKQEEARRRREQEEMEQREAARKEADRRELERKRLDDQKRLAEARERQTREAEALKAQAQREIQTRTQQQQAEREAQLREQQRIAQEREAQLREQQRIAQERAAQSAAWTRAEQDYIRRIQAKVRGNIIEPGELSGNPEAVFEVTQLPTGDIIDVRLLRSSGLRAYDDAVERAIRKSSPLPRPSQPELWQRVLTLQVHPRD